MTLRVSETYEVAVQDSDREAMLAEMLSLRLNESRIGHDAFDDQGRPFELKTTTRPAVSTARDLGPNHIKRWRERYWVIAKGKNLNTGFSVNSIYFMAPVHLKGWFSTLDEHFRRVASVRDTVVDICANRLDQHSRAILHQTMTRGMTLNDPGLPWSYVVANGINITDNPRERLAQLVETYPMQRQDNADWLDIIFGPPA